MRNIRYEKEENVGLLTISRPKQLNTLNKEVLGELLKILDKIFKDKSLGCLIITGDGDKAFIAGADVDEMAKMDEEDAKKFSILGKNVLRKLEQLEIPVIAAVNGYALGGGCELTLACDIIIISENAVFSLPEVSLGIIPGWGGTQRLPLRVGIGLAKRIIYTGEYIKAPDSVAIGLADMMVEKDKLIKEAMELGKKIASQPRGAISAAKAAINRGWLASIDKGLDIETEIFCRCFSSDEQKLKMQIFLKKQKEKGKA